MSLGEFEMGLSTEPSADEIQRLPTLLRLLSSARPLASIPSFDLGKEKATEGDAIGETGDEAEADDLLDDAVRRLENRASIYSVAEGVEVVSCHLAPAICRKISRLRPLKKAVGSGYDTKPLVEAAASQLRSSEVFPSKRRKLSSSELRIPQQQDGFTDLNAEESDEDAMEEDLAGSERDKRRRESVENQSVRLSSLQSEDSQEANVARILSELISLVVQSLKPPKEEEGEGGRSVILDWSISMEDSILAEAAQKKALVDNVGGAMVESDLGASVVSLLHYAPVLRHDHVAVGSRYHLGNPCLLMLLSSFCFIDSFFLQSALCRATLPQAAGLIARMAANAPPSVSTLVRGCIRAYENASQSKSKNHSIAASARRAIRALASLSAQEQSRIRSILGKDNVMIDVQLELAMRQDPLAAVCLLIRELSGDRAAGQERPNTLDAKTGVRAKMLKRRNSVSLLSGSTFIRMRSLVCHLTDDPKLLISTLQFLQKELHQLTISTDSDSITSWGRVSLTLAACCWLLCRVPLEKCWIEAKGRIAVMELLSTVHEMTEGTYKKMKDVTTCSQSKNLLDRPFSLSLCSLTSGLMAICSVKDSSEEREKVASILSQHLSNGSNSKCSLVFNSSLSCAFRDRDPSSLCSVLESMVSKEAHSYGTLSHDPFVISLAERACKWARQEKLLCALYEHGASEGAFFVDLSAANLLLKNESIDTARRIERARVLLSAVLERTEIAEVLLRNKATPSFIEMAIRVLLLKTGPRVPLILPVQIEKLASEVHLHNVSVTGPSVARFLLNSLYCLEYLELDNLSPLAVDPRSLPLKEIYSLCLNAPTAVLSSPFAMRTRSLIEKYAPEIPIRARVYQITKWSRHLDAVSEEKLPPMKRKQKLLLTLQKSRRDLSTDPSGLVAESSFLRASLELNDSVLLPIAVTTIVSNPRKPLLYFSFAALCKDPLILLKCPIEVFQRRGWRRILVFIMSILLEANDWMVSESCSEHDSALEYICSRNAIVIRCMISMVCNPVSNELCKKCGMTLGLVRRIVARRKGSAAITIKQLPTEDVVDWLVDTIPEVMEDYKALVTILSERCSLTAVERLLAADGILRIAVVQGHRYENEALKLAFSALSHFIASFFLVIGPVGVPVNTLAVEGSALDAVKASRRVAFRLVRATDGVQGYRKQLRKECAISLQKLAGLCKSDNSSLPGPVAARLKVFLKDLLATIQASADAIGSGYSL